MLDFDSSCTDCSQILQTTIKVFFTQKKKRQSIKNNQPNRKQQNQKKKKKIPKQTPFKKKGEE